MILVAIPCLGVTQDMIDKAVRHALAQTADCVVLVAGDGQKPPVSVRHDRLVVGTFPTHMGTPATQQAMILGSPFEFYAPHGADDFTDPDHLASLAKLRSIAAGSSMIWWHPANGRPQIARSRRTWIEFGLFRTDLLRSIGGYNPAEPCGQDSVVISILVSGVGVPLTRRPTYHKVFRANSLTHDPETRQGSPIREAVKARNRVVLDRCARLGWRNLAAIRQYRESLVPDDIRLQLDDRAALVADWLA